MLFCHYLSQNKRQCGAKIGLRLIICLARDSQLMGTIFCLESTTAYAWTEKFSDALANNDICALQKGSFNNVTCTYMNVLVMNISHQYQRPYKYIYIW